MSLEGQQIHRYRIVRLLGSGGMGDVYLAEDPRIEQQVAIKVIRAEVSPYPDTQASQEAARLFQREARAIARLDHPHILPLYDYGEERMGNMTIIYLVMPYRREGSLSDWLRQRGKGELLAPQEVAHFVRQAASALQHAHTRQIIHQDVKPSNFLLHSTEEDPGRPDVLLADFGVAKLASATASMSHTIRGTPTYMAPEQWSGEPVAATDQYALAIMAYELLAGRPPFQGPPMRLMHLHATTPPSPPSTFNPRLSAEVDTVLLHALAKPPEERFTSMTAFANAFEQAVQAQAAQDADAPTYISATSRLVSQVVPAATELALPAKPSVGRPAETIPLAQVGQQVGVMPTGQPLQPPVPVTAQPQRGISRRTAMLGLAGLAVVGVAGGGLIWLARSQQPVGTTLYTYHGHSNIVHAVTWNPVRGTGMPDGRRIASASSDWTVQVWDAADGGNVFSYRGHASVVDAVAWAPHGRRIASGSYDNTVQVWNAADAGHVFIYRGHASVVNAVAWSPDGTHIASASRDKTVQVWESANGGSILAYRGHSSWVNAVAWSPAGRYIVSGSADNTVQVWDAVDGVNVFSYRGHASIVNAVAWSPDGRRIASAGNDWTVQVWDAIDGGNVFSYRGHSGDVLAVVWHPDGKRLASGSVDTTVQVWDAIDGGNVLTYRGHSSWVYALAWSPDGKDIASGSRDKTVQVWVAE